MFQLINNKEKNCFEQLILGLPLKSVIVEIGTFWGGTTKFLAELRNDITIYSFDTFEISDEDKITDELRTFEKVVDNLKSNENIFIYKKKSPYEVNWDTEIDVYFEDACHWNPNLSDNVNYWKKFVKPNGFIVFHNVGNLKKDVFPDVSKEVKKLLSEGWGVKFSCDSLLGLQKLNKDLSIL